MRASLSETVHTVLGRLEGYRKRKQAENDLACAAAEFESARARAAAHMDVLRKYARGAIESPLCLTCSKFDAGCPLAPSASCDEYEPQLNGADKPSG